MKVQNWPYIIGNYPKFIKLYLLLKKSQWWNKEKIKEYQLNELKKLITHSYKNIPYYRNLFNENKIKPENIKSLKDIEKIPYLTKDIVRNNIKKLKAINYPKKKFELFYTGGSTGEPLKFYIEKGVWYLNMRAFGKIQKEWMNISFFDKKMTILGGHIPIQLKRLNRVIIVSSFYLNEKYLPIIIQKIFKIKPKIIIGYPSAITILAQYIKRNNIENLPKFKSIISCAETLFDWQRVLIENIFKCTVHEQYCLRESALLGITCEHSNLFHFFPEFGIMELIGKDGKPVKKEGEIGEIVGTGFRNNIFPFIRYKTGDMGVYTNKKCECGRKYPLLKKIEGRKQEFIVSKNNQIIPIIGFYGLINKYSDKVFDCQFNQEIKGELLLNIVKTKNYSKSDEEKIKNGLYKNFKNQFDIKIIYVDNIPRTESGKNRFIIQKIN